MVLGLILSHTATVPELPGDAMASRGVELNKTLSLSPWELYSSLRVITQLQEYMSFLPACGHSPGRTMRQEGERPTFFLALSLTSASLQGRGLRESMLLLPPWGFSSRYLTNLALFGSLGSPQGCSSSPKVSARAWAGLGAD